MISQTKKVVLSLSFALGALSFACTPTPTADCVGDADCDGNDLCHPTLKQCVTNCAIDGADLCGDTAPVCNEGDPRPLDDDAFNSMCVCIADSDCTTEGEICDLTDHVCTAGDAAGPCTADSECAEGEFCDLTDPDNGVCSSNACTTNDECTERGRVCDIGGTGTCEDPDLTLGGCAEAAAFASTRATGGPVLYADDVAVDFKPDAVQDDTCDGIVAGSSAYVVQLDFFDAEGDGFVEADPNADKFNALKFSRDGTTSSVLTGEPTLGEDGKDGLYFGLLCFVNVPTTIALQLEDKNGNVSNAYCADLD